MRKIRARLILTALALGLLLAAGSLAADPPELDVLPTSAEAPPLPAENCQPAPPQDLDRVLDTNFTPDPTFLDGWYSDGEGCTCYAFCQVGECFCLEEENFFECCAAALAAVC